MVKVTKIVFGDFFFVSGSESEDDEEDDEEEDAEARRAFFTRLIGGWLGLFLPNWSLSEKRSVLLSSSRMASVESEKIMPCVNFESSLFQS